MAVLKDAEVYTSYGKSAGKIVRVNEDTLYRVRKVLCLMNFVFRLMQFHI